MNYVALMTVQGPILYVCVEHVLMVGISEGGPMTAKVFFQGLHIDVRESPEDLVKKLAAISGGSVKSVVALAGAALNA